MQAPLLPAAAPSVRPCAARTAPGRHIAFRGGICGPRTGCQVATGGREACRAGARDGAGVVSTSAAAAGKPRTASEPIHAMAQTLRTLQAALLSTALLLGPAVQPSAAVLNSPNAQIARSVDAALRRSIPAFNPSVAQIQKELEDVSYFLRIPQRKPWGNMASNVQDALSVVAQRDRLLEVCAWGGVG